MDQTRIGGDNGLIEQTWGSKSGLRVDFLLPWNMQFEMNIKRCYFVLDAR